MPRFVKASALQDSGTDEEIPLPNVKTAILSKAQPHVRWHSVTQHAPASIMQSFVLECMGVYVYIYVYVYIIKIYVFICARMLVYVLGD